MAYATVEELQKFTGNYIDDDEQNTYQTGILNAAADIINQYIGYNGEYGTYTETLNGTGRNKLLLNNGSVISISSVKYDGIEQDINNYGIAYGIIFSKDCSCFPRGFQNIQVSYTAGFETIPDILRQVNLEIAALILTMADGNIGITSKTFGADGSRNFIQNVDYKKYLKNLDKYRI